NSAQAAPSVQTEPEDTRGAEAQQNLKNFVDKVGPQKARDALQNRDEAGFTPEQLERAREAVGNRGDQYAHAYLRDQQREQQQNAAKMIQDFHHFKVKGGASLEDVAKELEGMGISRDEYKRALLSPATGAGAKGAPSELRQLQDLDRDQEVHYKNHFAIPEQQREQRAHELLKQQIDQENALERIRN